MGGGRCGACISVRNDRANSCATTCSGSRCVSGSRAGSGEGAVMRAPVAQADPTRRSTP